MLLTAPGVKLPSCRKNGFKASWWRCGWEVRKTKFPSQEGNRNWTKHKESGYFPSQISIERYTIFPNTALSFYIVKLPAKHNKTLRAKTCQLKFHGQALASVKMLIGL